MRARRYLAAAWLPATRRFAASPVAAGLDLSGWVRAMEREAAAATPADRLAFAAHRAGYGWPVARGLYPLTRRPVVARRARRARGVLAADDRPAASLQQRLQLRPRLAVRHLLLR